MGSNKLINIAYDLPFNLSIDESKLTITPNAGGLSTVLTPYFNGSKKSGFTSIHWIGTSDLFSKAFDNVSDSSMVIHEGISMHPVFQTTLMKENFYDGFCNSVLWPLFLYFPSFVNYKKEFFDDYVAANEMMCKKVTEVYEPGDTIWIHDYHWMLLPTLLRESIPDARIGFFLHIPFPSFELYRSLPKPWRTHLLLGLMGADVIGLQTREFVKHFMESVGHVLPDLQSEFNLLMTHERTTIVNNFSISVDYEKFHIACRTPVVHKLIKEIRADIGTSKIILSVDRLDYTKAISTRLESYAVFLDQNPEFCGTVSYILSIIPTHESILKYEENKIDVEALVGRINAKYGTPGWTPVVYQYQKVDFTKLVALYGAADVALVVPYRDGMNLVAKEYVSSRFVSDGVLILGETVGAASEMQDAILVNPNDTQEVADAIVEALVMTPNEQRGRIRKMQQHLEVNDVNRWASDFLGSIERVNTLIEMET